MQWATVSVCTGLIFQESPTSFCQDAKKSFLYTVVSGMVIPVRVARASP
jgi:hypothetical protein